MKPGREPVYSTQGLVCSISPQAVNVGASILSAGGNAFDAIVAMAAVEGVTTSVGCGPVSYTHLTLPTIYSV